MCYLRTTLYAYNPRLLGIRSIVHFHGDPPELALDVKVDGTVQINDITL